MKKPDIKNTFNKAINKAKSTINKVYRIKIPPKAMKAIIACEVIILLLALGVMIRYARTAPAGPNQYFDPSSADVITSADGILAVNGVTAIVPTEGDVSFSVAYGWAETDKDYPSVPRAAVATYYSVPEGDDSGAEEEHTAKDVKYEISLYKEESYGKDEITDGKTAENWFSDWGESEDKGVVKSRHTAGGLDGFLVSSLDSSGFDGEYRSFIFYFAVQEPAGISVYAVEGINYDSQNKEDLSGIMDQVLESISVNSTKS